MIIDCCDYFQCYSILRSNELTKFGLGSRTYGTSRYNSDCNNIVIVPDDTLFCFEEETENIYGDERIHSLKTHYFPRVLRNGENDSDDIYMSFNTKMIRESDFNDMVLECFPLAVECLSLSKELADKNAGYFLSEKKKIMDSFSNYSLKFWNNSFENMKKTGKIDRKSLFNSIRLIDFATQVLMCGYIFDFTSCRQLWIGLMMESEDVTDIDYIKVKYSQIRNTYMQKMIEYC